MVMFFAGGDEPKVPDNASVKVLRECIELQRRKSSDYQNPNSSVRQAMHYRRGVDTIHDMLEQKLLRARSLIEAMHQPTVPVTINFESLEDTYKDVVNYASFAVAYLRGEMDGQNPNLDAFNRPLPKKAHPGVPHPNVDACETAPTDEEIEARYHHTRHAKARGLPKEMSEPPFPEKGDPAYDKEWPVDPYTAVS